MNASTRPFRLRSFVSLSLGLAFLALLVSGAVLFLAPPGRIANWTNWAIFGLTKRSWSDLHIVFGAVFILGGITHLLFNLRPFLNHLGSRARTGSGWRWEWVAAVVLAVAIFAGSKARVAPFAQLLAWSESLRQGWEDAPAQAPIPHAEVLTLAELSEKAGVPLETARARLTHAGLRNPDADARVQALADSAHLAPAAVFDLIRANRTPMPTDPTASHSGGRGRGPGGGGGAGPGAGSGGGGPGWKTLAQFCADEGLELAAVETRLKSRGLRYESGQTLREIAVSNGYDRPFALLEILRQK